MLPKENETPKKPNAILPGFTKALTGDASEDITVEDMNQLQIDLEHLLSTVVLQRKALRFKRKSLNHALKVRKLNNSEYKFFIKKRIKKKRINNMIFALPKLSFYDIPQKHEVPKSTVLKSETSDRYWLSVDPICGDITKDNTIFLDTMVKECDTKIDVNLPECDDRYFFEWTEESIDNEQLLSSLRKYLEEPSTDSSEDSIFMQINHLSSSLQKQLQISFANDNIDSDTLDDVASDNNIAKNEITINYSKFHGKLRQAFLKKHVGRQKIKNNGNQNEVAMEIKKCISRLQLINKNNLKELNGLKEISFKDLQKQEVREPLVRTEEKLLAVYRKVIALKDTPEVNATEIFPKISDEDEVEARKILNIHNYRLQEFNSFFMSAID